MYIYIYVYIKCIYRYTYLFIKEYQDAKDEYAERVCAMSIICAAPCAANQVTNHATYMRIGNKQREYVVCP